MSAMVERHIRTLNVFSRRLACAKRLPARALNQAPVPVRLAMQAHAEQELRPKYNSEVLDIQRAHDKYVKLKMYAEAKSAHASMASLMAQQLCAQQEAFRGKQSAEQARMKQRHAKEVDVLNNKLVNERFQIMMRRKQETELLIRKYNASAGLMSRVQHKQRCTLQVILTSALRV